MQDPYSQWSHWEQANDHLRDHLPELSRKHPDGFSPTLTYVSSLYEALSRKGKVPADRYAQTVDCCGLRGVEFLLRGVGCSDPDVLAATTVYTANELRPAAWFLQLRMMRLLRLARPVYVALAYHDGKRLLRAFDRIHRSRLGREATLVFVAGCYCLMRYTLQEDINGQHVPFELREGWVHRWEDHLLPFVRSMGLPEVFRAVDPIRDYWAAVDDHRCERSLRDHPYPLYTKR